MITFTLNGKRIETELDKDMSLRDALYALGCTSVRDSDDHEGFTGSDIIIFNGKQRSSNLTLLYKAEGAEIRTAESLRNGRDINWVQKAMIRAGVVQSAYNSPTVALLLTWLLENKPDAGREDVKEILSSVFIRDAGYEHFYLAVKLAQEMARYGEYRFIPRESGVHRQTHGQGRRSLSGRRREGIRRGQGGGGKLRAHSSPFPLCHGIYQEH